MTRNRAAALLAIGLAVTALLAWRAGDHASPPPGPDESPGETSDETSAPTTTALHVAPAPRFSVGAEAPTSVGQDGPSAHPSPAPGDRRGEAPRDPGFCPEPGEERSPYPRRSLAALLNERTDELVSRARVFSGTESDELRRGLRLLNEPGRGADAVIAAAAAPDRRVDGFDFASAIAVAAGARALARQSVAAPNTGPNTGQDAEAIAAFEGDPEEPAVAFALGQALAHTPDEEGALRALAVYLEAFPDDIEAARLARRLEVRRDLAVHFRALSLRGVTLRHHRSISEEAAREALSLTVRVLEDAARLLGVSRRPELSVVAYGSREELRASTCVPGWAGGVFDGTLRLAGPTMARRVERERVIRHEGLHAALGAAAGPTPYWFNEGLAQRFAGERTAAHRRSWARLRRTGLVIPFPSLDGSFLDIDDPADAGLAYHQSLAMVDLLAARRGERVFADAVTYLRGGGDRRRLFDELAGARPLSSA
ncbi:MAG: hypothetical protein JRH11_27165, partial [Deltaproteobacteria bacterium]|nr:hypothetical protein [Deltaproteobacteria bacterium]